MAGHSEKAQYAAFFAMKESGGDHLAAKKLYDKWMPEEHVSKWKPFAHKWFKKLAGGVDKEAAGERGRKALVTVELALKIGIVYAQRKVWAHGKWRHYFDMDEVRAGRLLTRRPLQLPLPTSHHRHC